MPTFEYTALDPAGARVRGALGGASENAVLAELEARKLTPVRVREKRQRRSLRRGVSTRALAATRADRAVDEPDDAVEEPAVHRLDDRVAHVRRAVRLSDAERSEREGGRGRA